MLMWGLVVAGGGFRSLSPDITGPSPGGVTRVPGYPYPP